MSIKFNDVSKSFGTKKVLDKINFEINKGEIFFIIGRSGTGKSVTLKHIVGLLKPDHGSIDVDGQNINQLTEHDLRTIRKKCGMVFQHPALLDFLNVLQNLEFSIKFNQLQSVEYLEFRKNIELTLKQVHLDQTILNKNIHELSYGMQKKLSIARTLLMNPDYLLFDEPTTSLDPISSTAIFDLVKEIQLNTKTTAVVVSHDLSNALKYADRILVFDSGKIIALGTPKEIVHHNNRIIQQFLENHYDTKLDS